MPLPCQGGHRVFLTVLALPLLLVPGFMTRFVSFAAEPAKPIRSPWTTSRVVGSPDPPPPFKVVRVFPNLKFERPLLLAR